ncbi:MAG: cytidine deaminase [Ammonifex sp.]|jgi:cytidine deaminase|nr:MAG: cytidine deaminase [Ammonifex sp.]
MQAIELVNMALAARENAYAPYSGISVGAALLTREGRVFTGVNVENVSYALTVCAERVAVVNAVSAGCRRFDALAVAWNKQGFCRPCGACRQVLYEFNPEMRIIMADYGGEYEEQQLKTLLPNSFEK